MELPAEDNFKVEDGLLEVRIVPDPAPVLVAAPEASSGSLEVIVPAPWLLGARDEILLKHAPSPDLPSLSVRGTGLWLWWRSEHFQTAAARLPLTRDTPLEEQVYGLYRELLKNLEGWKLLRVWNFLPRINEWRDGQENYRRFNQGRARAFQAFAGEAGAASLPAASAVGAEGDDLVVFALACTETPLYRENPEQIPAYQYPEQYGPTPPSFARGSVVEVGGTRLGFISGTAAIKGHQSLAAGDLAGQVEITVDNLRLMAAGLGFSGALEPGARGTAASRRFLRIYLRDAARARDALELLARAGLELAEHEYTIVKADVCRAELDIEIEARLSSAG